MIEYGFFFVSKERLWSEQPNEGEERPNSQRSNLKTDKTAMEEKTSSKRRELVPGPSALTEKGRHSSMTRPMRRAATPAAYGSQFPSLVKRLFSHDHSFDQNYETVSAKTTD